MFVSEHIPISMSHYLDYCWIYCLFSADHNCLTLSQQLLLLYRIWTM